MMKTSKLLYPGLVLLVFGGFLFGIGVGRYEWPPFSLMQSATRMFRAVPEQAPPAPTSPSPTPPSAVPGTNHERFTEVPRWARSTDVRGIIEIRSRADLAEKRRTLRRFIWKGHRPGDVEVRQTTSIEDERFVDFVTVSSQLNKLDFIMRAGIRSTAYHFYPRRPRAQSCLILYHEGHGSGDFNERRDLLAHFLGKGCEVAAFSMPLFGPLNNQPMIDHPRFGRVWLTSHDHLELLNSNRFNAISLFLDPVVGFLNRRADEISFERIGMIGLSGGGWTTTLIAAIDERIGKSYPVAGTSPTYLRSGPDSTGLGGDWEGKYPDLYRQVNYLELYVLGTTSERSQIQVLNQFDTCCMWGVGYRTYARTVATLSREIAGGSFSVFLDDSHASHIISKDAIAYISDDFFGDVAP